MRGNYISDWVISPTISNKGMIVTSSKRNILFNKGNDYEGTFQIARNVLSQKDDVYFIEGCPSIQSTRCSGPRWVIWARVKLSAPEGRQEGHTRVGLSSC